MARRAPARFHARLWPCPASLVAHPAVAHGPVALPSGICGLGLGEADDDMAPAAVRLRYRAWPSVR
jgi:hypothetical protein